MPRDPSSAPPAGVLRRAAAFALDVLIVNIVLSVVGTIVFTSTDGLAQTGGLLPLFSQCGAVIPVPAEINPTPEFGDDAVICSGGALPLVVSERTLIVSVTTHPTPGSASTSFETHSLSASGRLVDAHDLTWLAWVGLIAYFAISFAARGRTPGMHLVGLRLLAGDEARPRRGVPIPRLFIRTCVALAGFALPALAFRRAFGIGDPGLAYAALLVGIVGPIAWITTNVALIATGGDPVYDRLSGLRVSTARS